VRYVVLAVGRVRPPFSDDVQHYRKMLAGYCRVEQIEVREDQDVQRRIPDRAYVVLLDRAGRELDSVGFAKWIDERRLAARDVCFVIGGPYGTTLDEVDERLSFGPITLPHQLARVVLLEQLYRGHKILAREPYHH
jgi:23S rRNA (pseudouridine1915-N3)-methyltransferase